VVYHYRFNGLLIEGSQVDLHVDRLSVAILRNPTANAVTYFQNDVLVLKDIMAAETRVRTLR
jgi:hypothetical protein